MPTSRSPSRTRKSVRPVEPPRRSRFYATFIIVGVLVVLAAVVMALPASLLKRFLPPDIQADDFSGSIWHGSAGRIGMGTRDFGAIEWHLHAAPLLRLKFIADLHWVKVGFVIDAVTQITRAGVTARDVQGGGPLEDLRDLGVAAGWHGIARVKLVQISSDFQKLTGLTGALDVSNLAASDIAGGAELGGYELQFASDAVAADGTLSASLHDTGGPVEAQAQLRFMPAAHVGMLSGTLRERDTAAPALREQLSNLAQFKPRDANGRIPVELEFTL